MGYSSAVGMIESAGTKRALSWHLHSNHYPSIYSEAVLRSCLEAIAAVQDHAPEKLIRWEEERFWPKSARERTIRGKVQRHVPASEIARLCHLDAFVYSGYEEE